MKSKTVYYCTNCGNETPKWQGQCYVCGSWDTIIEAPAPQKRQGRGVAAAAVHQSRSKAAPIAQVDTEEEIRFSTGMGELDRVLGGGAVKGSLVLVGGAPGIGKSTLLLQICGAFTRFARVLYVTGEESQRQLKMRADRLGIDSQEIYVLAETNMEDILASVEDVKPDILIIDSIQTVYNPEITAAPGSISQVKDCTMTLMQLTKGGDLTTFVIGHVNKEGSIAGPKVLEHMVDCVLYFEGEQSLAYRILRADKNRFGSTNEIGVFEMSNSGLVQVENPSEMLLSGRPENTPGTCVTCVMEGTRPLLAEIQALVAPTNFNVPRRTSNGLDYNRAMLILAVLEKRGGLKVAASDVYINVIGGLSLDEPAADLAAILAVASSYLDKPVPSDVVAVGEVGLTGELRAVSSISQRLSEVRRLGFKKCILPEKCGKITPVPGLELIPVATMQAAIRALFAPSVS